VNGGRSDGATGIATRLGGFLLLVVVVFLIAFAVGAHVGPVGFFHGKSGGGGRMTMSTTFTDPAPGSGAAR
jgi:hypothetical protein